MSIKKALSAMLLLLLVLVSVGCENEALSPKEFTDTMLALSADNTTQNTTSLDGTQIESFFGFKSDLLSDFSVVISSHDESVFEIGALEIADQSDLNTVIDGINRRRDDNNQTLSFINNSSGSTSSGFLLMQSGNTVIYALAPDVSNMSEVLAEMGATEIN